MKIFKSKLPITFCISLTISGHVFAENIADVIYQNGAIYTVNEKQKWAEAVAIDDGKFIKIGSNEEVLKFKGSETKVVDLKGQFVMPGLIDEHIHPDMGADNYLNVFIKASDSWDVISDKIKKFRNNNPDKKWIYGGTLNWLADDSGLIAGSEVPSNKKELDKIVSDRPVALWDQGAHAMLLNSMALKELGIENDTAPPPGGIIVRDKSGEATGVIRETTSTLVTNALDNPPADIWTEQGMNMFLQEMSSYGVTGVNDAYGTKKNLDAYRSLEKDGKLNTYVHVSLATPLEFNDPEQKKGADTLIRNRADYASDLIHPNAVKYIMDGSAAGQTAAMLEPFLGTDHRGGLRYDFSLVEAEIKKYAELGLAFKVHAIGDRAIRGALDIYEKLPPKTQGTMNSVAHGTFISPDDISRYSQIGVVFEASPALWFPNDGEAIIRADIGDRTDHLWPIKELVRTGALVSYGSDWTVSLTPNPWIGMETMVTREKPGGSKETLDAKHGIEMATTIQIFTLNGAKAIGLGAKTGSIEEGKYADMIVLDRNLFTGDIYKVHKTNVQKTIFHGKEVFQR